MDRVDSPRTMIAPSLAVMGIAIPWFVYAGIVEDEVVHNFAALLIKGFEDRISPFCKEKKNNVEVMHCFFEENGWAIPTSKEERLLRDLQEYKDQYRLARAVKTMSLSLLAVSAAGLLFACRAR